MTTTQPAAADPAPIASRTSTGVTSDALPTVQIDGVVWDQVIVGDTVYAGGSFTSARPAGSPSGTNENPRSNLLSYNLRTGVLNTNFAPTVNAQVKSLAVSPDQKTLYIAGGFTQVNGVNRNRLASFTIATGALTNFIPAPNATVAGIAVTDTAVYAGGTFSKVGSAVRNHLAAFSPATGALLDWAPSADANVQAVLPTPDKSRILVAGNFANLNNTTALGLGALDINTGATLPWVANTVVKNYGSSASMLKLRTDGTTVYAVGYWYGGANGNFEGVLAADPNSGNVKWLADCHGDVYDVTPMNDFVYNVSHWHYCGNIGGFPDTNPRKIWYHATAVTKDAQGTVAHNGQGGYTDFYGQPAPALVNFFPTLDTGTYTGQSQAAWSAASTSQYLVLGGEFPKVNGVAQQGLVRFAVPSIAPNKQGPRVTGADFNPTLLAVRPDQLRIKWTENYDRDDQTLTYTVIRSGTTAPIYTTTTTDPFWLRKSLSFTDTGLTPGQTYKYRVSAADPDGNTVLSNFVSITMPTSVDPYVSQVITDGAADYWRLNGTGTNQADYTGSTDQTNDTGATSATPGALTTADAALSFDGSASAQSSTTAAITGPTTFSEEAWFKTTSTSGGKIVGFGCASTGNSGCYDRHIYMDNSGKIIFGVYPGSVQTISSTAAYNDGQWHHVVSELSPAGMALFLDGIKVASNAGVTTAQEYSGFWRIGSDNISGWTNQPSNFNFTGQIDEVAIYPTALSGAQVRDHYTKSGRTLNIPAAPTDSYGSTVYRDEPLLYWRLNDASGSPAADITPNANNGTYAGGVTYQVPSTVADPGYAAGFNGSDGTIGSNNSFGSPSNYTEEIWFNTTSTGGGKLIGFGNQQSGTSSHYDRHVYMDNSGHLTFGTYTGQLNLATSPNSYNDGKWHYMVASQSNTDGMKLYVDGALVGTNSQTGAESYTGYWRVGGDSAWCCNNFFNGTLDEAAVYDKVLTAAQVQAHYNASPAAINVAPTAAFTATCADGSCSFDSSGSADSDGSIASYAWDFGDGQTSTNASPNHPYAASGTYSVNLTVTDNKGATNLVNHQVSVTVLPPNQNPTAAFTNSCIDRSCTFNSSTSSDPDGTIASYAWTFGDGSTSTDASPTYAYAADGTYAVKLIVTDDRGGTSTVTNSITVHKNVAPTARFSSQCADLACTFDGSGSSDPDGTLASYAWNFGDGQSSTLAKPSHTFATSGSYNVSLTVTDNNGGTDTKADTVTVTVTPNQPPVASFSPDCNQLACNFDGSASSDPDGTVASYAWDFGDGASATTATTSHTYASAGSYSVTLTITDNKGTTGLKTVTVQVSPTPNTPPVASFTSSCTTLTCSFDSSASTDPDGSIVSYAWQFGDGTTESSSGPSHTYTAAGTYAVKLTVTDNKGDSGSSTKNVTVAAANVKPTASFTSSCTNLVCAFDGSASADSDGTIASSSWDFGDSTTLGTGTKPNHTYSAAGTYSVKLTVTDNGGATGTTTKSVTVTAAPAGPIAADAFSRTATKWGNADTGGAWTTAGSTFSTNGSVGLIKLGSAGVTDTASLSSVSARDVNVVTDLSLDKLTTGSGVYNSLVVRKNGTSDYRVAVKQTSDGRVNLTISSTVSGTSTTLKAVTVSGLTYAAGDTIRVRFQVSGNGSTTLAAKAWKVGSSEPAAAQVTATDSTASLQSAGSFQLVSYLASSATNAPITVSVDNLSITAN